MRILVVTATAIEIAPMVAAFGLSRRSPTRAKADYSRAHVKDYSYAGHDIVVLTTGVGMVATAAWCSGVLVMNRYDLALNVGVCGSFDRTLEPGAVVHVLSDRIAELGAEGGDAFLTVDDLKLESEHEFKNASPPAIDALSRLPRVSGITVNTVHGNARSIAAVAERFKPQVESMEGAAFMYACIIHEIPFAQVRAVSNIVETRNRDAWKMSEAIANLNDIALQILDQA